MKIAFFIVLFTFTTTLIGQGATNQTSVKTSAAPDSIQKANKKLLNHYEDVLYLKNGSIIRGRLIENRINDKITIELLGGSILVYPYEEMIEIKKELKKTSTNSNATSPFINKSNQHQPIFANKKYFYSPQVSLFLPITLDLRLAIGKYSKNQKFKYGIGTGFDFYLTFSDLYNFIPLYAMGNYHFTPHKNSSLILTAEGGYGLGVNHANTFVNDHLNNGPYFAGGIGMAYNNNKKTPKQISIQYKQQNTIRSLNDSERTIRLRRFVFRHAWYF